jgi:1A family penicillin-binding protein
MKVIPSRPWSLAAAAVLAVALTSCVKLPNLEDTLASAQQLAESSYIFAADGSLITSLHEEQNRESIPIDQVPVHVQKAVVAIEDSRFFEHPGVDLKAIVRAFLRNTAEGKVVEGGSTITQQYIKNALIVRGRTLRGKLDEAALAWQLEQKYSKAHILELYLNTVYFGEGAYGIETAAQTFFGKRARDLTVPEGALLAGLIRSPSRYDPYKDPDAAIGRRNLVLSKMREQGFLTPGAAAAAAKTKPALRKNSRVQRYPAAHFVEYVKDLIQRDPRFDVLGSSVEDRVNALFKGGLRVYTTIDLRLQRIAEQASKAVLRYPKDPHNAFVALDPRTGAVRAMVGGRDFFDPKDPYAKFNLAVQSKRQPGSSFKPFTLVAALEEGIPLERIYRGGSVITIDLPGGPWVVHNYESLSFGSRLSLREATIKSVNVVYAQVVKEIGARKVVEVAQRMGITSPLTPLASIAIGTEEVSPLELASAYAPLANGGNAAPPVAITKITDSSGKVLYESKYARKKVLEPQVVALAVDALKDVISKGTGRREKLGRPAAGKTGTADQYHDAWFAGMTPQLVAVSWVGFPRAQIPMYPPRTRIKVVGGSWPGQIWKTFMLQALQGQPPIDFPAALSDLVHVRIDVTRNCLPNPFTPPALIQEQVFLKGTEPKAVCTEPTTGAIIAPNVIGRPRADAVDALEKAGYLVNVVARSCPSYPEGYVCDQSPAPGSKGTVGDRASVYVSDDNTVATVPMVLGKTLSEAKAALQEAGFTVEVVSTKNPDGDVGVSGCRDPDQKSSGRVWLQSFCSGEQRPKGSAVRIYVNP